MKPYMSKPNRYPLRGVIRAALGEYKTSRRYRWCVHGICPVPPQLVAMWARESGTRYPTGLRCRLGRNRMRAKARVDPVRIRCVNRAEQAFRDVQSAFISAAQTAD